MRRTFLAVVLSGAGALISSPAAADLKQANGEVCYDLMVVGTVKGYGEFVSLYQLVNPPDDDDALYIGGRQEMGVRIDEAFGAPRLPGDITVRAMMTSAYRLPVQMLFYLQREERGSYWAADWLRVERDALGRVQTRDDPPPRCPRTAPAGS